jgi:hypothetical protein
VVTLATIGRVIMAREIIRKGAKTMDPPSRIHPSLMSETHTRVKDNKSPWVVSRAIYVYLTDTIPLYAHSLQKDIEKLSMRYAQSAIGKGDTKKPIAQKCALHAPKPHRETRSG